MTVKGGGLVAAAVTWALTAAGTRVLLQEWSACPAQVDYLRDGRLKHIVSAAAPVASKQHCEVPPTLAGSVPR